MVFWSPRAKLLVAVLSFLLVFALVAEWSLMSGRKRDVIGQISKLAGARSGWVDARQLQMQAADSSSETISDTSSSSNSSSSASQAAVKFMQLYPQLNKTPQLNVGSFQPTVYGPMAKQGHLAWEHWSLKRAEDRVDHFLSWRMNRTLNGPGEALRESYTCQAADHPKLPFPGCHVFINHKYKYIYIRSPKAASTSIVDELGECNNMRTRGHAAATCMGMHNSWEQWYKDPKNITDMWRDYFVFGFVRNPWRRAYSLYKYMQSDGCMAPDNLNQSRCRVNWGDFCTDPWGQSDKIHNNGCLGRSKSYMYFHMMDQYHCMVTDKGEWAVDFIGRVEQTNEDWAQVVAEINKRKLPEAPPIPVNELVPRNVSSGSVSDPYAGKNTHCLDAVSRWYACDIEKFAYMKGTELSQ